MSYLSVSQTWSNNVSQTYVCCFGRTAAKPASVAAVLSLPCVAIKDVQRTALVLLQLPSCAWLSQGCVQVVLGMHYTFNNCKLEGWLLHLEFTGSAMAGYKNKIKDLEAQQELSRYHGEYCRDGHDPTMSG